MGVIQRQSIKNSAVNAIGVLIGAFSTLFIYPLDLDLYGAIQTWIAAATLLVPILTLGSHSIVQKFFPYFQKNNFGGFLKMVLLLSSIILIATSGILYFAKDILLEIIDISEGKKSAFKNSFWLIYGLSIIWIYLNIFRAQAGNFKRIVIPDLIEKTGFKIFLPFIILLSVWGHINLTQVKYGLILFFATVLIVYIIYLKKIKAFDIVGHGAIKNFKTIRKKIYSYMGFNILSQVGSIMTYQIDKIMLSGILLNSSVGIYSIFLFLAAIIDIPTKAVFQISSPLISEASENKDFETISDMYKKTSLHLLIIGVFIFCIIWLNIDNLFLIMVNGKDLQSFKLLFLFLGIAKLMDMLTSVNNYILLYSPLYRYNLLFVVVMAIVTVTTNYFFIKNYGILGAGIATSITIIILNLSKTLFIWLRMGLHPFQTKQILLLPVLIIIILIKPYIILPFHPISNTFIIGILFTFLYVFLVVKSKLSVEINNEVNKLMNRIKKI